MSNEKGLIGLIVIFIVLILAGLVGYFIFFRGFPSKPGYEKRTPQEMEKIHESSFVEPGEPPR